MADHLVDDEAQEFLGEVRIQIGVCRKLAQARDLPFFAARVGRRQVMGRFIFADRLGDLKALGKHEDERRVDIVDTLAIALQSLVHARPPNLRALFAPSSGGRKLFPLAICILRRHMGRVMTAPASGPSSGNVHPIGRANGAPSLAPMMALVAQGMNQVNAVILDRMQSRIPLIPELAGHLIAGGGKRMRPMLTLACAQLVGYAGSRHYKLAAAVEFIHTATLLHDDVVDGSGLRRGRKTANIIWGNSASVLVGDFLFSRAFELMVEAESLKVLKILSNASAVIAEGEVNQLTAQRKIDTSEEQYLDIIGAKTAALFAAACRISAVVADRDEAEEKALDVYGRNLGIAFQLIDDAIDYESDGATMGKDAGDDFRDGKVTLPVILAYARGSEEDRAFWKQAIAGNRVSDEDLAHATQLLRKTGAIDDTLARARLYGQRAIDALGQFDAGTAKAALTEAVEFAIARAY